MSELIDIRRLIMQGAPADGREARRIIRTALDNAVGDASGWTLRLCAALTEILVGHQLRMQTCKARADALAVIDEIDRRREGLARLRATTRVLKR